MYPFRLPPFFALFCLPLIVFGAIQDSVLQFRVNGKTDFLPCSLLNDRIKMVSVVPSAVLHERQGIQLSIQHKISNYGGIQIPFVRDQWFTFYFRFDSCSLNSSDSGRFVFLAYQPFRVLEDGNFLYFLSFGLDRFFHDSRIFLTMNMLSSKEKASLNTSYSEPVVPKRLYCLESHLDFFSEDSLHFEYYLDGKKKAEGRHFFVGSKKRGSGISLLRKISDAFNSKFASVAIADFVVSDTRTFAIPPAPRVRQVEVDVVPEGFDARDVYCGFKKSKVLLDSLENPYEGEYIRSTTWRLFKDKDTLFPLLWKVAKDPADFYGLTIPLPLDSGEYQVQAKWENNFKNQGGWSPLHPFSVNRNRSLPVVLKTVSLSADKQGRDKVSSIVPGQWYWITVNYDPKSVVSKLGYLLIHLNSSAYPFGNLLNKGGGFSEVSNYVLNLSFVSEGPILFEKSLEGSDKSTKLTLGTTGLYLDAAKESVRLDTATGTVGLRFRLLNNAAPGNWNIEAALVSYERKNFGPRQQEVEENYSNIIRNSVEVLAVPASSNLKTMTVIAILAFLVSVVLVVCLVKRRGGSVVLPDKIKMDATFTLIAGYIESNISKKLSVKSVCTDLRISKDAFQAAFKARNDTFLSYLTRIRIEKSKTRLLNSDETIAKIAFELGFVESQYFCKVFKKQEGLSPGDFRKNRQNVGKS